MPEIVWIALIMISGLCAFSLGISAAYFGTRRSNGA